MGNHSSNSKQQHHESVLVDKSITTNNHDQSNRSRFIISPGSVPISIPRSRTTISTIPTTPPNSPVIDCSSTNKPNPSSSFKIINNDSSSYLGGISFEYSIKCDFIDETECPICFWEYKSGDEMYISPCNHVFHHKCIEDWFKRKLECPNCRYTEKVIPIDQNILT